MGTFRKGLLGGFSGTVGTVIGGNWNGIDYMRSLPVIRKKQSSAQEVQRLKFSLAAKFLRSMKPLLMLSFKNTNGKMTGQNNALSYTLKNAVTGVYPDFEIDYKMALVARGTLPNAYTPVAAAEASAVRFTWESNEGLGSATGTDKAILVAYHPPTGSSYYTIGDANRNSGTALLKLGVLRGQAVEPLTGISCAKFISFFPIPPALYFSGHRYRQYALYYP